MGSSYDTAMRAAAEHVDTRTPEQKRWDERANRCDLLINSIVRLTRVEWKGRNGANCIQVVRDTVMDLDRELNALALLGDRPGSPAKLTEPRKVEAVAVPVASNDRTEAA